MTVRTSAGQRSKVDKAGVDHRRLQELISFRNRLSGLLSHTQDFASVVDEVFTEVMGFVGADAGLLRLVDDRTRLLEIYQSKKLPLDFLKTIHSRRFGEGLAGYVAQSGEAICINTGALQSPDVSALARIGMDSVLAIPLRAKERVMGTLELFKRTKPGFDPGTIADLLPLSQQIGTALENIKLLRTLEARISQRNRLYRLMRKLQVSVGLNELLTEIVKILSDIYSPAYAVILLYDPSDQVLRIKAASRGFMEKVHSRELPLNRGVSGYAAMNRVAVVANDTGKDPRYLSGIPGILSELAVPLIAEDRLIGVLDLESTRLNAFSDQDSQLLTIYAQQAAMAIVNAQLFEQSRERSQAKTRMISSLSHEFKTPLAVMKSYAWYLLKNPGLSAEERREQLDVIVEEVDALNNLIENLLNLGRMEQGHQEWQVVCFEMSTLLASLVESMDKVAAGRNINIAFDPGDNFLVWGDVAKTRQVFMNLLSNAIKYNRKDGSIWVAIEDAGDDFCRVMVRDSGIGIEPDYVGKIFDSFYRVPGSSAEGVGLGLALARQYVEAQGGWIEVESKPGEGTRFYVYLSKRGGA